MLELLKQPFERSEPVRALINVGARLDIVSGNVVTGRYGESIINGGLPALTGVVGLGNQYKTKLLRYLLLSAWSKFYKWGSTGSSYDTETNVQEEHQYHLSQQFKTFRGINIINEGSWILTDKTIYTGDQYFDVTKEFLNNKIKNKSKLLKETPFVNREVDAYMRMSIPTFRDVDSFSEFSTQDVLKMQDDHSLGESGANTVNMREGLQKNRFLRELAPMADNAKDYVLLSAHLGSQFDMDPRNPTPRKLAYLKQNLKIKGAPEKFTFLTNICWYNSNASPLINQGTKGPEYPLGQEDNLVGDTDLNEVMVRLLRNKTGPSGMGVQLVISQSDGVLEDLTNFHYIKIRKRYGLIGNDRTYACALLPEVNLSRTTIRRKLLEDDKLCRAIELVADLCQVEEHWDQYREILCTPEQLYEDIKTLGYDWDVLLNTRSWWTFENDKQEIPFLTIIDLLKMRAKQYVPYWLKDVPEKVKDVPRIDRFKGKKK